MDLYSTRKKVENTESFKKLDSMMQSIVKKRNNIQKIDHHLKVIDNQGYDKWLSQTNVQWANKLIINEIVKY